LISDVTHAKFSLSIAADAVKIAEKLDERGAWVEEGKLKNYDDAGGKIISSKTFILNLRVLARCAGAK